MERNNFFSSNRAITLVALIITIIVMLILVAVTVSVLVESDIIGQAEQAGNLYQNAYNQELKGNMTINGKEYENLTDYINTLDKNTDTDTTPDTNPDVSLISFTIDGTEYQAESGMTWGQWQASEYNTNGFKIKNNLIGSNNDMLVWDSNVSTPAFSNAVIDSTHTYIFNGGV